MIWETKVTNSKKWNGKNVFSQRCKQVYVSVDDLMPNDSQLSGIRTWTSSVVPATAPWLDNAGQTASWLDVIAA